MSIYLRNAHCFPGRLGFECCDARVDSGPGGTVVPFCEAPKGATAIDCTGKIVTSAFVNAHHHVYSTLARGMPPPRAVPSSFLEILELVWWRLDKALDLDMVRASARAAAVEAARCGCTFVIDHHSSPNAAEGSLRTIVEAFDEVGVGILPCYELSERDGRERLEHGLAETEAVLRERPALVGLHASFTVGPELLERAVALADAHDTGLHLHVAEDLYDQEHCLETYGKRVVQRLDEAGALRARSLLAHCVHLDDDERALLAGRPAWIVRNTESNENNRVGRFDPRGLPEARLLLGTDGMHHDMLRALRATWLLGEGAPPARFWAGLHAAWDYLDLFDLGGANHLVVLGYDPPTPVHEENFEAHIVHGMSRAHVETVIAAGKIIVQDRRVVTVDEEEVMAHAREQAERLWKRL